MSGPVYLLSSLPYLDSSVLNPSVEGSASSLEHVHSVDDFISLCEYTLAPADAQKLSVAMRSPQESSLEFVLQALEYLSSVSDEVARKRHESRRSGSYTHAVVNDRVPVSADAAAIAERAAHAKNPLLREMEILKALWAYLDDCDAKYQFSIENVIIYGYKLKLFHKAASFQKEAGDAMWKQLGETLAEKAGFFRSALATGGGAEDKSRIVEN